MQLWKLAAVLAGAAPVAPLAQGLLADTAGAQQQAADLSAAAAPLQPARDFAEVAEAQGLAGRLALARGSSELALQRARRVSTLERKADRSVAALLHRATHVQAVLGGNVQNLVQSRAEATLEVAALRNTGSAAARATEGWEASARAVQAGLENAYHSNARLHEVLDAAIAADAEEKQKLVQQNLLLKSRLQSTVARERQAVAQSREATAATELQLANATQRAELAEKSLARVSMQERAESAALGKAAESTHAAVLAERQRQRTDAHDLDAAQHRVDKLLKDNADAAAQIHGLREEIRAERAHDHGKVVPQPARVHR